MIFIFNYFNIRSINIIIMLRRLAKPALNILALSQARAIFSAAKPVYSFATGIEPISKLKTILTD